MLALGADAVFEIFGVIALNKAEVISDLNAIENKALETQRSTGRSFRSIGANFAKIAGVIGAAATGIGAFLVKTASDAEETQTKLEQVFGDMAEQTFQFANSTADSYGRSRVQVQRYLADLQAVLAPTLENREAAASMSQQLTQLTFDLASFHNMAEDDVLTRLRSGLLGSTEAVDALGVNIRQTALEQEMLRQGMEKSYNELTEQEKIWLRFQVIMRATSDAQGDAIRTGEGFANQMRRLQANITDAAAVAGNMMLPIVTKLLIRFNEWFSWLVGNAPKIQAIFEFIGEVIAIVFKYIGFIVRDTVEFLRVNLIRPFAEWLAGVWEEHGPAITSAVSDLWDGIKNVFSTVFNTIRGLWDAFSLAFQGDWAGAWEKVKETAVNLWDALPGLFEGIINPIINLADTIMTAVIDVIRNLFGDNVADIFQTAWDQIVVIFEGARDILLGIWRALTAVFQGDWSTAWDEIKNVASLAWDIVTSTIETALTLINTIIDQATSGIVELIRMAFGDRAAEVVQQGFDVVKGIIKTVTDAISGIISVFTSVFAGDWAGAWEEVKTVATNLWGGIQTAIQDAIDFILTILGEARTAIVGVVEKWFGPDVANIVDQAFQAVIGVVEGAKELIMTIFSALNAAFKGDWETAWEEVKKIGSTAWDVITSTIETALTLIDTIVDRALDGIVELVRMAFGDRAAEVVEQGFDVVKGLIDTATAAIRGIINVFTALFKGDWDTTWEEAKNIVSTIWNGIQIAIQGAIDFILTILEEARTGITDLIGKWFGEDAANTVDLAFQAIIGIVEGAKALLLSVFNAINAAIKGDWETAWNEIKSIPETVLSALTTSIEAALNVISNVINGILNGIVALFEMVFGKDIANHVDAGLELVRVTIANAKDVIVGAFNAILSLVKGDWEEAWNTVVETFEGIWNRVTTTFDKPIRAIVMSAIDLVVQIKRVFEVGRQFVVDTVRGMVESIQEWFGNTKLGKTVNVVGETVGKVTGFFANMYDAVVGHSYVPDMVEEIGEAFERLKEKLAAPVEKYTAQALSSFEGLSDGAKVMAMEIGKAFDDSIGSISSKISGFISDISRQFFHGTATWLNIFEGFANMIGGIFGTIFDTIVQQLVKNILAQNTWLATTLGNIAASITAFLSQAYAALTAFFWYLGPGAPVAAAGVIAAAIAGIAAIGGQIVRGILPDSPSGGGGGDIGGGGGLGGTGSRVGHQVSEITGSTRDLLTDLLTPLVSLNTLTGIGERIYNLLNERLPTPGMMLAGAGALAAFGGVSVTVEYGAVQIVSQGGAVSDVDVRELSEQLAEHIAFKLRGSGQNG